jgi:hypothetical protein
MLRQSTCDNDDAYVCLVWDLNHRIEHKYVIEISTH